MAYIDYYKTLGLSKTASEKDIKNAYRKLARKYHPDLNPNDAGANKKFQEINEANEVLSDPEKRKKYDKYGENWQHADAYEQANQQRSSGQSYTNPGQGAGYGYQDFGQDADFSDFFQSMFGNMGGAGRGGRSKYRGQDFQAELSLSLADAALTQKQTLTVNGKNIRLTIPAGVENGQTIKITGHGAPGVNGGPSGDLYITFKITDDPRFKRSGSDLYAQKEIDLYTALLGGEIIVETLNGKVKVNVKPETQNGTKIKLKGKGFPVYKKEGQFGDLFITYNVKLPVNLSEKQKELIRELSQTAK